MNIEDKIVSYVILTIILSAMCYIVASSYGFSKGYGLPMFSPIPTVPKSCYDYKDYRIGEVPVRCLKYFNLNTNI